MKISILTLLTILMGYCQLHAQEAIVDSIQTVGFRGISIGGNMGEFLYVPYFTMRKTEKQNFIIQKFSSQNLAEETKISLELPGSYTLNGSTTNDMGFLLSFYDAAKKEDVLITVKQGNIVKKKTMKAGSNTYIPCSGNGAENFTLVTIGSKGNYSIEKVDMELNAQWKKTFSPPSGTTWDVLSVQSKMSDIEIMRKENKSDNKYAFTMHRIQADEGADLAQKVIGNEELAAYPTFFSEKEGMNFTGGYYFKNGIYNKQPDGVFISAISMDGTLERPVTVPFSQVLEGLKGPIGNQLATPNTALIFNGGLLLHESQKFSMTGQIITRADKEGGSTITLGDFVTITISMEGKFKDATIIKNPEQAITLKGDVSGTNMLDLGIWLQNASLLQFRYFVNMPGNPIMGYRKKMDASSYSFCFRNVGLKSDTTEPVCVPINNFPAKETSYDFAGLTTPPDVTVLNDIITSPNEFFSFISFGMNNTLLSISKMPIPSLEKLQVLAMPEPPELEPEPGQPAEENKAE